MKNKLLSLFLFLGSYAAYSQVGIGTPMPNASSQLEVVAADKGVLIPKISLTGSTDATTITNGNVNSLLVFNTATISDIKPGYYYWFNNKWNRIVISTEITANPGTVIYNPTNQQFTYIDASGNTQNIDIGAIVKANETVTSLVNNGGGSYTYTNEAGTAVNIDVVGDVTTNFSTIVNNPAVTNIIKEIVKKTEGNVFFDSTTNQFTYVDNSGNTQIVDISTIVKANETITTLDKDPANNGQYTYTSENATSTKIDVVGDIVNNANTILNNPAFITELTNIIKTTETLTTLVYDKAANTLTYKDEDENLNTINLLELVSNIETKTTLVYDPVAKTLTYNGESGTPTVINLVDLVGDAETITTQSQNPTTGVITYTNEAGTAATAQVTSTDAGNILTVGSDGGSLLTPAAIANATTVSNTSAVNNLTTTVNGVTGTAVPIINSNETSLTGGNLVTTVNGVASAPLDLTQLITISTTNALSLTGNTLTSTVNGIPASSDAVSGVSNASAVNTSTVTVNGITSTGAPIINSNETSLTGASLTTTVNGVTSTALDLTPVIKANETVTTLAQDLGTGTITYTNEAGTPVTSQVISTNPGNIITAGTDGGGFLNAATIKANETITTITPIVNSGSVIATYTNEAGGAPVEIQQSVTKQSQDPGTGIISFFNEDGFTSDANVISTDPANIITVGPDGGALLTPTTLTAVTTVSNASTINTATVTVNGVTSSGAPIINSNAVSLTGTSLTTTVNGVASTTLDLAPAIKAGETITTITPIVNSGNVIATYVNEAGGVPVEIQQSVTKQTQDPGTGIISFHNEDGFSSDANVISSDPANIITVGTDGGALLTPATLTAVTTNTLTGVNGNLVSTVNGVDSTPAVPVLIAADNGLTAANGNVQLGGTLITPTTIVTDFANTLAITGLMHGMPMDEILVTDPGGGVIRTIKPEELNFNNWSINGNFGTIPQVHFLGTLDNADLVFRRSSVISGRIEVNNTSFGVNAFNNNPTGQFNAAFGTSSLLENTTGTNNTAIGYNSLTVNGGGSNNTAAGSEAGSLNTSGSANTFIGNNANPTGGAAINNATAIGNNAKVATSNSLVLGGTGADAVNVGIGTDAPTNSLHIKPAGGIDPIRAEGLQPSVSGTDNIVVADASGVLKTANPNIFIPVTTVSNSSSINSLTTTVNGVTGTAVNLVNSNTTSLTGASLNTSVNGVASTALDLTPAIKAVETITAITPVVTTGNTIATYTNEAGGTPVEVKETVTSLKDVVTQITDPFGQLFDVHTLTYTDETNTPNPIDLSILVKGVETLTSLVYDGANHSLIYSDEHGNASEFKMVDLIGESETLTTLEVNATTGTLDYTNEDKVLTQLDLGAAVKEPWFSTTTHMGATLNTEDIYTNGWVGIGYTTASGAPNEKLRVNGAISTVNTYYADYVFEDYFKGSSEIKSDYKFKHLPEIEDYIKKYNHLPGITPINRLEKTKEGYAFNMSELSIQLLEKSEELYLHLIEQSKVNELQNKEIEAKDKEIKELKEASKAMNLRLEKLEKLIAEKNN